MRRFVAAITVNRAFGNPLRRGSTYRSALPKSPSLPRSLLLRCAWSVVVHASITKWGGSLPETQLKPSTGDRTVLPRALIPVLIRQAYSLF